MFSLHCDAYNAEIPTAFEAAYQTLFGRVIDGLGIEVTNWSLVVALSKTADAQEIDRAAITAGQAVEGPAVVVGIETTTIVSSGYRAVGQGDCSLRLIRKGDNK